MKFKEYPLSNEIRRALSELGFINPLKVQKEVLPIIFEKKDVVVKSQTGSGKTAAFAIPICEKISIEDKYPQAIVIAPTRELALQINEDIKNIGRYRGVRTQVAFGKTLIKDDRDKLKTFPHIVIATPGRLNDLIDRKFLKTHDLEYLVLDEADELLNLGFEEQIHSILSGLPTKRTTLLFSATMPDRIEHLIMDDMNDPERVIIESEVDVHKKIEQIYYEVEEHKKLDFLKRMLDYEQPNRCIIFANTQNKVESIYSVMKKWNNETGTLHGGMEQEKRMQMISKFKRGELKYLIATDLASRGLHVRNLTHVINFNIPFEYENYVHRIGRTGRVNETGIAISLCSYKESERINELEEYLGYTLNRKGPKKRKKPANATEVEGKKQRFKVDKKVRFEKIKIHAGRNAHLKAGDIMHTITRIPGVTKNDLGQIHVQDFFTTVEVNKEYINQIASRLRKMKLKGKSYRIQLVQSKRR